MKILNKSLDGRKTIGYGLFMMLLGAACPAAKEWIIANPDQAADIFSSVLTISGAVVAALRKWKNFSMSAEEEELLAQIRKGRSPIRATPVMDERLGD